MQRQIKACTHCRQHKVRCDAAKCYPNACTRCSKFSLNCIVDQNFKPRKGGQVELLREHLSRIQEQIQSITTVGVKTGPNGVPDSGAAVANYHDGSDYASAHDYASTGRHMSDLESVSQVAADAASLIPGAANLNKLKSERAPPEHAPHGQVSTDELRLGLEMKAAAVTKQLNGMHRQEHQLNGEDDLSTREIEKSVAERMAAGGDLVPIPGPYILDNVQLEETVANGMHEYFMTHCAPYMPMFQSKSAGELYARSEFLFWAVMITAALAEPTSHLYVSMVEPVRRLIATKCLVTTTRSSSVVQALLVLSTWPLPSVKMLEDMSLRFVSLAYSMGQQLGMHRGKFIYEFSRNQQLMPNAVKWRTRTWVQTYITAQMVSSSTGIPAPMPVDHMIDHSLHDKEHPLSERTRAFLKFARFYSKIVSLVGSSINTQDGLTEANTRCPTLDIMRSDLTILFPPSEKFHNDPVIEIIFLYANCIIDAFAFLPDTPQDQQSGFIIDAFHSCTRIVTLTRKLVGNRKLVEFPSFIRNPCCFAALILFRLHLMPQLPEQYVASARESIVTSHHLFRNVPQSWLSPRTENDISRTAKLLEGLNHVIITRPEMLQSRRVLRRMRSHLTFSLFYELIYTLHEARRRNAIDKSGASDSHKLHPANQPPLRHRQGSHAELLPKVNEALKRTSSEMDKDSPDSWTSDTISPGPLHKVIHAQAKKREINPLPLFNDINMDSYFASTAVSPNGTTSTKLFAHDENAPINQNGSSTKKVADAQGYIMPDMNGFAGGIPDGPPLEINTDHLLDGIGWMDTEGDDFLGWMMPRNE